MTTPLRIAIIGHAFMGRAHAHAWRTAPAFFDLPLKPEVVLAVGREGFKAQEFADTWGIPEISTDWREAIAREDIDVIDICTPGDTHAEIAIAALQAGKHVLCEKPLANTLAEATAMARAAEEAHAASGALAMCGFSYRRTPALSYARQLVEEGFLGRLWQVRAQYLQDWLADPEAPWVWRLASELAGSGALGDIGSHIIDAAQWVSGHTIEGVSALTSTFVDARPLPDGGRGEVDVDDAAVFSSRLSGGVLGAFEATRYATGRKNALRVELSGTEGAIAFDLTDSNFVELYRVADGERAGFARIDVSQPGHPYAAWWPPGHALGYEHAFSHQAVDFVRAVAAGEQPRPSFADAAQVQAVLDAVQRSAAADGALTAPTA
ncbi:gfo/Idh/MocA family oxidoreductase [Galactobacter valiniphilus]|uniref:Gfo/Idh/MocA family oxidoreductase n=1 Tax=Galactobacter valiniphilus TaxID=2676122 RepID=A0A399JCG1_9MICC|nr:Gfo/Idh/MocA family oxidoreductase [Galactobacter valiniphilus]RII43218.1 gfo/Idh/MocA family oxidoreductase [Galactobacter valiniphilus]